MLTTSLPIHPAASIAVTEYDVVMVGVAVGLAQVAQLSPADGVQLYVIGIEALVAPAVMDTLEPLQIAVSLLAATTRVEGITLV